MNTLGYFMSAASSATSAVLTGANVFQPGFSGATDIIGARQADGTVRTSSFHVLIGRMNLGETGLVRVTVNPPPAGTPPAPASVLVMRIDASSTGFFVHATDSAIEKFAARAGAAARPGRTRGSVAGGGARVISGGPTSVSDVLSVASAETMSVASTSPARDDAADAAPPAVLRVSRPLVLGVALDAAAGGGEGAAEGQTSFRLRAHSPATVGGGGGLREGRAASAADTNFAALHAGDDEFDDDESADDEISTRGPRKPLSRVCAFAAGHWSRYAPESDDEERREFTDMIVMSGGGAGTALGGVFPSPPSSPSGNALQGGASWVRGRGTAAGGDTARALRSSPPPLSRDVLPPLNTNAAGGVGGRAVSSSTRPPRPTWARPPRAGGAGGGRSHDPPSPRLPSSASSSSADQRERGVEGGGMGVADDFLLTTSTPRDGGAVGEGGGRGYAPQRGGGAHRSVSTSSGASGNAASLAHALPSSAAPSHQTPLSTPTLAPMPAPALVSPHVSAPAPSAPPPASPAAPARRGFFSLLYWRRDRGGVGSGGSGAGGGAGSRSSPEAPTFRLPSRADLAMPAIALHSTCDWTLLGGVGRANPIAPPPKSDSGKTARGDSIPRGSPMPRFSPSLFDAVRPRAQHAPPRTPAVSDVSGWAGGGSSRPPEPPRARRSSVLPEAEASLRNPPRSTRAGFLVPVRGGGVASRLSSILPRGRTRAVSFDLHSLTVAQGTAAEIALSDYFIRCEAAADSAAADADAASSVARPPTLPSRAGKNAAQTTPPSPSLSSSASVFGSTSAACGVSNASDDSVHSSTRSSRAGSITGGRSSQLSSAPETPISPSRIGAPPVRPRRSEVSENESIKRAAKRWVALRLLHEQEAGGVAGGVPGGPASGAPSTAIYEEEYGVSMSNFDTFLKEGVDYTRSKVPSAAQLARLPLLDGANTVVFEHGTMRLEARLFVWPATAKIVVCDVDGTITKSDVKGHLSFYAGFDWIHPNIACLFTTIAKHGYKILYLTARSISQYDSTRRLLAGVHQRSSAGGLDGGSFRLPEGALLTSPDRTWVALQREVILRKPQEFKIAALREVRSLFSENPFYAGFGNRETDAVAYENGEVGVPATHIFIVNERGVVKQHANHFTTTEGYAFFGPLVQQIFPVIADATPQTSVRLGERHGRPVALNAQCTDAVYWSRPFVALSKEELEAARNPKQKK